MNNIRKEIDVEIKNCVRIHNPMLKKNALVLGHVEQREDTVAQKTVPVFGGLGGIGL